MSDPSQERKALEDAAIGDGTSLETTPRENFRNGFEAGFRAARDERAENAPEEIELLVCERCGRTNRYFSLSQSSYHFRDGQRCDGNVVTVTYGRLSDV